MDTTSTDQPQATPKYEGFAAVVADALHATARDLGADEAVHAKFVAGAVEKIDGAHQVRVRMLQHEAQDEQRAAAAYAAMDVANQKVMQYAKAIVGQLLEVNGQQAASLDGTHEMRRFIHGLLGEAMRAESDTVPMEAVEKLAAWPVREVPHMPPFVVGMAVDTRYVYGQFTDRNTGIKFRMSFLGWSLVIHTPPFRSTLEPTFLDRGATPKTRLDLMIDGFELEGLH
jgi:hypothetical protein